MPKQIKDDPLPNDKEYNLWLLLSQTRSAIFRARQEKVGHYLHPNQALALCTIWGYNGQATPAIISRSLFLERHSVSELISRMEEKGLVKKTRDEKKKNVVRVSITEKGRKIGHHVIQREFINGIISTLTEDQQEQLRESLNILMEAAQKSLGTDAGPLQGPQKASKTKSQ
jgi:MarR family transcriptional regulator, organic hydroperoxide resistance regulator